MTKWMENEWQNVRQMNVKMNGMMNGKMNEEISGKMNRKWIAKSIIKWMGNAEQHEWAKE